MIIIIHEVYACFTLIAKEIYRMLFFDEKRFFYNQSLCLSFRLLSHA